MPYKLALRRKVRYCKFNDSCILRHKSTRWRNFCAMPTVDGPPCPRLRRDGLTGCIKVSCLVRLEACLLLCSLVCNNIMYAVFLRYMQSCKRVRMYRRLLARSSLTAGHPRANPRAARAVTVQYFQHPSGHRFQRVSWRVV